VGKLFIGGRCVKMHSKSFALIILIKDVFEKWCGSGRMQTNGIFQF
jgi:hypothetical protein